MRDFSGRRIVITGGSSGLGLALATELAQQGAQLGLVARNRQNLDQATRDIKHKHGSGTLIETAAVDVSDEAACQRELNLLVDRLGGIDMLINCAGILREGHFQELSTQTFRDVMDINLFGVLNASRALLPALRTSQGRIVNIASIGGLTGVFGYAPYCASKHALVGLTETMRCELKPQGIRVQLVCPPEFDSPMVEALDKYRTPENKAHTLTIPKHDVQTIVHGTLKGIKRGSFLIVPGTMAWMASLGMRHFPRIQHWVVDRVVASVYKGPQK